MNRTDALAITIGATDLFPSMLLTFEDNAVLWAARAAARSRERNPELGGRNEDARVIRILAVVEAIRMLADPRQEGSAEMLTALLDERRKGMH